MYRQLATLGIVRSEGFYVIEYIWSIIIYNNTGVTCLSAVKSVRGTACSHYPAMIFPSYSIVLGVCGKTFMRICKHIESSVINKDIYSFLITDFVYRHVIDIT